VAAGPAVSTEAFDIAERLAPSTRGIDAAELASRLPDIVIRAREVAATVVHGAHGRRRAGTGENFWQFRPFGAGEAAHRIDWRRSAREKKR
jgi:uncharacterized protein (DUF58 family)